MGAGGEGQTRRDVTRRDEDHQDTDRIGENGGTDRVLR